MAEFVPEEDELEESEEDLEPYPIPRRIRTRRPWRAIACTILIIGAVAVMVWRVVLPEFSTEESSRLARIDSLQAQIEDQKLAAEEEASASDTNVHTPKSVCDIIAKAQTAYLGIDDTVDLEDALASAAKSEFTYMQADPAEAAPWVWFKESTNVARDFGNISWKLLTPLTFEGASTTVAWALFDSQTPYAVATATYDASGVNPQISDVSVSITLAGQAYFQTPPENIMVLFNDPAWIKENMPKTSTIQTNPDGSTSASNTSSEDSEIIDDTSVAEDVIDEETEPSNGTDESDGEAVSSGESVEDEVQPEEPESTEGLVAKE